MNINFIGSTIRVIARSQTKKQSDDMQSNLKLMFYVLTLIPICVVLMLIALCIYRIYNFGHLF